MSMPKQDRGRSRQDYGTPDDLLNAVRDRFGPIWYDLAACADNAVCNQFLTPQEDSLSVDWDTLPPDYRLVYANYAWLNPPFSNIAPWARKCAESSIPILMLVPASVGSNWYRDYVEPYADVKFLNPRVTFKGCATPYPKDCMLCVYSVGTRNRSKHDDNAARVWHWK